MVADDQPQVGGLLTFVAEHARLVASLAVALLVASAWIAAKNRTGQVAVGTTGGNADRLAVGTTGGNA